MVKVRRKIWDDKNGADSVAPGERNEELVLLKDELGLPKWQELTTELQELSDRHGIGFAEELAAKVSLYQKYTDFQTSLANNFKAAGLDYVNVLHNAMDLQLKLFELEEKLKAEGRNPLESDEWVRGRGMLDKNMEFIHKHKLDTARFQKDLDREKRHVGDDSLFTVEAEVTT